MKRIKFNTTWEEDEEERRQFFANLSYSERLRYGCKLRHKYNFNKQPVEKVSVFKIYHSHDEEKKDSTNSQGQETNL